MFLSEKEIGRRHDVPESSLSVGFILGAHVKDDDVPESVDYLRLEYVGVKAANMVIDQILHWKAHDS